MVFLNKPEAIIIVIVFVALFIIGLVICPFLSGVSLGVLLLLFCFESVAGQMKDTTMKDVRLFLVRHGEGLSKAGALLFVAGMLLFIMSRLFYATLLNGFFGTICLICGMAMLFAGVLPLD